MSDLIEKCMSRFSKLHAEQPTEKRAPINRRGTSAFKTILSPYVTIIYTEETILKNNIIIPIRLLHPNDPSLDRRHQGQLHSQTARAATMLQIHKQTKSSRIWPLCSIKYGYSNR